MLLGRGGKLLGSARGRDGVPGHSVPVGTLAMGQPRVCVLTSSFPDGPDDVAGVFVREQVQRLSQSAFLDVVYPSRRPAVEYRHEPFVRRPIRYPFGSQAMSQVRGIQSVRALDVCTRMAAATRSREPYDLYHAYWAIPSGFVARCVKGHRPLVITLCGSDVNSFGSKRGFRDAVRWALAGATRIIAVSNELLDRAVYLGLDPSRGTVIPSGVDTRVFSPVADKTSTRAAMGLPDGFLCVYVGSLFRIKRVDRLIRAIARVDRDSSCTLIVVGDGPERDSLQTLAGECDCDVRFFGWIPHAEISRVVGCCDAFVMASMSEGLPTSAQEAMCCGVPVVALDVGGLREIVIEGMTGLLARDETQMARIVGRLVEHRDIAMSMGKRAYDFARCELSVDRSVDRTLKVYDAALRTTGQAQSLPCGKTASRERNAIRSSTSVKPTSSWSAWN